MFCLHLGFLPDDINKIYKFESNLKNSVDCQIIHFA